MAMRYSFSILAAVLGSSTAALTGTYDPASYYPDWVDHAQKCVNDGKAPDYIKLNPTAWTHATLAACCDKHFSWNKAECYGDTQDEISGYDETFYYPDWMNAHTCVNDGNADTYMKQDAAHWFFPTLEKCCERWYAYDRNACLTAGSNDDGYLTSLGTNKWYVDWTQMVCVKDCVKTDANELCGGLVNTWDMLHATYAECCENKLSWNRIDCIKVSGRPCIYHTLILLSLHFFIYLLSHFCYCASLFTTVC